jgi:hypothetical protein
VHQPGTPILAARSGPYRPRHASARRPGVVRRSARIVAATLAYLGLLVLLAVVSARLWI